MDQSRFWSKVDIGHLDECWPWIAALSPNGYGAFRDGWRGKQYVASRLAWILTFGPIASGKSWVLHRCDNPPCCNPAHLFLGTRQDNVDDMMAKGRHWSQQGLNPIPRGMDSPRAKITDNDVRRIRHLRGNGLTMSQIEKIIGISDSQIGNILNGKCWTHVV